MAAEVFWNIEEAPIIKKILTIFILCILSACQEQIDPRDKGLSGIYPDPDSPLIGTSWFWDGGWGAVTLNFDTAETVLFIEGASQFTYKYVYVKSTRNGQADSLGRFSVTENYDRMIFSPTWRGYPHGADFTRID